MGEYVEAALGLHRHMIGKHWNGKAIAGPDPIGRINWRVTRFVRSYTRWLPWSDNFVYCQGQGYWIRANLCLFDLMEKPSFLEIAEQCADYVVRAQLSNGVWEHPPLRERKGFISTVETVWACLGLIAAYRKLGKQAYLDAVLKGYDGLINVIGFRRLKDGLAINYYASSDTLNSNTLVPNVTTMFLWLVAEVSRVTVDDQYLKNAGKMLRFLEYSQMENGELRYHCYDRPHFMGYQYNSFQFLDLAHYYQVTEDEQVSPILNRMASYLSTGVTKRGSSRYNCFKEVPEVNYWTAALATALRVAHELGLGDYLALSERAYRYLLTRQRTDGGFDFSERTYGFLRDRRSYPRYLAMVLYHLLCRVERQADN